MNSGGGLDIVPDVGEGDITSPGDIEKSSVVELVEESDDRRKSRALQ